MSTAVRTRPRGAWLRPLGLAGVTAVLGLGTAGCAIDLSHLRPGAGEETEPTPEAIDAAPLAESALAELAERPALRVTGQMAPGSDDPWEVELVVADTGTAGGTYTADDDEVEVMEVDDRLFVLAGDTFWLTQASSFSPDAEAYPDNWVRVPGDTLGADLRAVFTPANLSEILGEQVPGDATAVEDDVDGTPAYRISLTGGEMWVAQDDPNELLRLQMAELESPEDAGNAVRADVTFEAPDSTEIEEFYDGLVAEAEDLGGARDSRMNVAWDDDISLDCSDDNGTCTVAGTIVDLTGAAEDDTTRARMDATVSVDSLGEKDCRDTQSLEGGGTVDVSCTVDFSAELADIPANQTLDVEGEALLSTRALSGGQVDDTVELLEEQRDDILERADA